MFVVTLMAVSYTHLDVYKRQERLFVMHQRRRRDALELQRRQQIGQKVFDAASKRRVVLAEVQNAHG